MSGDKALFRGPQSDAMWKKIDKTREDDSATYDALYSIVCALQQLEHDLERSGALNRASDS
jgi:hypothetical protein